MTVTINLTQEHIRNGARYNCLDCPAARAIDEKFFSMKKKFPEYSGCLVYLDEIHLSLRKKEPFTEIKTPAILRTFIRCFENYRPVQPISFKITVPDG